MAVQIFLLIFSCLFVFTSFLVVGLPALLEHDLGPAPNAASVFGCRLTAWVYEPQQFLESPALCKALSSVLQIPVTLVTFLEIVETRK